MKITPENLIKIYHRVFNLVDKTIEHRAFTPVAISIIATFLLFCGYQNLRYFLNRHQESSQQKRISTPIKINVSDSSVNLDIAEDQTIERHIKYGETILKILNEIGVNEQDTFAILNAMKKFLSPKSITAGDLVKIDYHVKIGYDSQNNRGNVDRKVFINSINISTSPENQILISRNADGSYLGKEIKLKLNRHISRYFGTIKNGLFVDGVQAGISPTSMMNMINLYGYDVDFQRDIHDGDKFEMLVESFFYEDGKKAKDGNVLFSSLTLKNRSIDIYMHKIDERIEYFDANGNSVRKSLLRTPINGARVSSGFGLRRHPILGYSKMHKGTDFAASSGTPILAAGSGVIAYMGIKGGYGNYVRIQHNNDYSTAYGHASRFNNKFHVGSKVKQSDIVAYVGSTGRSTGPHLHFEVLYKGTQINPATVKATSGIRLAGKELIRFKNSKSELDRFRKNIPNLIH